MSCPRALLIATLVLFSVFVLPRIAPAATHRVTASGSGDFPTIQAALDAAEDGDIIILADGLYRWSGNRDLVFLSNVTLQSESGPEYCILDCVGSEAQPHRAFALTEESGGVIAGLTIRNGWHTNGGGATVEWGTYHFENCVFLDNHASGRGGAVHALWGGAASFVDCVFSGNVAGGAGGALSATAGKDLSLGTCTLVRNGAPMGGAVYVDDAASLVMTRCITAFGLAGGDFEHYYGGGFSVTCSNSFGNRGGDWLVSAAGVHGNIEADPRLRDPMAAYPDVRLALSSPCRASASACGTMGAGAESESELVVYGVADDATGMLDTIGDAIDMIRCPAEIRLEDGLYRYAGNRNLSNQGRSLLLASRSGVREDCVIDVTGSYLGEARLLRITAGNDEVVLEGLTLEGGYITEDGGLLAAPVGGDLTLRNCLVRDNRTGSNGGAIAMAGGQLTLEHCILETNRSSGQGGAVFLDNTWLTLLDTEFNSNTAVSGGGLAVDDSHAAGGSMINCEFLNHEGGAWSMREARGSWTIDTCAFTDNDHAEGSGGGARLWLIADEADVTFQACTFSGNHAGLGGGLASTGSLALIQTTFLSNSAVHGGGLHLPSTNETCVMESVDFIENVASASCGAAYVPANLLASNLRFLRNRAEGESWMAGAMLVGRILGELDNCLFEGNEAILTGALDVGTGTITNSVFVNNRADEDYAALNCGSGVVLRGCTLAGNLVSQPSGAEPAQIGHASALAPVGDHVGVVLERTIVAEGGYTRAVSADDPDQVVPPTATCSCIWGLQDGPGTLTGVGPSQVFDPLFCGLDRGNVDLTDGSGCLPENNGCGVLIGARPRGCDGDVGVHDVAGVGTARLLGNHPNPFNPVTEIAFELNTPAIVMLDVLDAAGRRVAVLAEGMQPAGRLSVKWHALDGQGRQLSSGLYLARLRSGEEQDVRAMMLIR